MVFGAPRKLMEMEIMYQESGEIAVMDALDSLKVHRYVKTSGNSLLVLVLRVKKRL